jgi:predicted Zn-dependent protease with MMP-like domain
MPYLKYIKYKKKYIKLKNIIKGGMFENLFKNLFKNLFDNLIIKLKEIIIDNHEYFGDNTIFHIKGGSSIYYHLKKNISNDILEDLTNDIDILIIMEDYNKINGELNDELKSKFENKKLEIINQIIQKLNTNLDKFDNFNCNWYYKTSNNLHNICININEFNFDKCIFDITFYNPYDDYADYDDDTSIFQYAMKKIGFSTLQEYINMLTTKINTFNDVNILDENSIDSIMFTTIEFEKFACEKGIELMKQYIDNIVYKWPNDIIIYKKLLIDNLSEENNYQINKIIKRLEYQISDIYRNKLQEKLKRYEKKYSLLQSI